MTSIILPKSVIIYTDGASRGNPGPASFGFVVTDEKGKVLIEGGEKLGSQTNNYAEYMAMIVALNVCLKAGAKSVTVRADSQLMIRQMTGQYKVKSDVIIPLFAKARELADNFKEISFEHIPREQNKEADKMANLALDQ